jgi:hypothetical protein
MAESHSIVSYRDISGWPGYRVGSDGSMWRAWVTCRSGRKLTDRWREMKRAVHPRGYLCVNLTPPEGGSYKTCRVHRLVLEAFVGPCPEGMECRHKNGVKADCRLENLCWDTPERNRQDNHDWGVYERGERHTQAKLTDAQVETIRRRWAAGGVLLRELAAEYHCAVSCISQIVNNKTRTRPARRPKES